MTIAIELPKNEKTFRKTKDWPQILALASGSLAGYGTGTLFAFTSPGIPKLLKDDYNFTIEEASYLTVIPPIALICATPVFCKLIDKIGRKYALLTAGIWQITAWLLTAFTRNIYVFYLSRIFYGFSDACVFSALPTYIAEVTTPKVRSLYGNMMVLFIYMGQFTSNFIGYYFSIRNTSLIMLVFPISFLTSFMFMPETPYYLLMIKDYDGAVKALRKLRACDEVQDEMNQLTFDVQRQLSESGTLKDLWVIKSNRMALVIANLARAFQQFSGFAALVVYSQYIFQEAGTNISSGVASMIYSGVIVFLNFFANVVTDWMGRPRSMILSCFCCGVVLLGQTIYLYLQVYEIVDVSGVTWFPVFGLVAYAVVFCIGLGVVPTLLLGEIFSTSIRRHAMMVTNIIFGIYLCSINKIFQLLMTEYGLWVPFLLFSICCFVSTILSYFIIPETKGKTLEEIQQMLKGHKTVQ